MIPLKRCGKTEIHEDHDWLEGGYGSTDYYYCDGQLHDEDEEN